MAINGSSHDLLIAHMCASILPVKGKQLIRKLRAMGVQIETGRGKGGHIQARHKGNKTVIKTHGAKDLSSAYIALVCKQLGINPEDL